MTFDLEKGLNGAMSEYVNKIGDRDSKWDTVETTVSGLAARRGFFRASPDQNAICCRVLIVARDNKVWQVHAVYEADRSSEVADRILASLEVRPLGGSRELGPDPAPAAQR